MNKCVITGRITKDPELRTTKSGTNLCEFTLATNRPETREGEKVADFINCIAWNKQAETLCKYQKKGNMIAVFGELRTDSYEVNGEKKYKSYVIVNNIEFLESKPKEQNASKVETPMPEFKTNTEVQQSIEYSDEDLPW